MKKLITLFVALLVLTGAAQAQTYPVQNLNILGQLQFSGSPGTAGYVAQSNGTSAPTWVSPATLSGVVTLSGNNAFTGTNTAPTAAIGTNTTQLATTAFDANGKQCVNIIDYGGDPTHTNSNNTAWTNAVAAAQNRSGQVCVGFPPGNYKFASAINYTNPTGLASIMIRGSGQDVTILDFTGANNGITITSNAPGSSAHIRDLTVATGNTGGGYSGIGLVQSSSLNQFAGSDIYNVTLRGDDNNGTGGTHYWSYGVVTEGQDGVNVESLTVYGSGIGASAAGIGLQCEGDGTQYSIYVNISKSVFNNLATGVDYDSYCQGITITQSNFQNSNNGFLVPASRLGTLSQLQISDSQFATAGNAIQVSTVVGNVMIHDNDIFVHTNTTGIYLQASSFGTIHGNNINTDGSSNTGTNGIVSGPNGGLIIEGNQVAGLVTCVWYQTSSNNNLNLGNTLACTTAVVDNGSSNSKGVATN